MHVDLLNLFLDMAPNVTSLKLSALTHDQLEGITWPRQLERLTCDQAAFRVVESILESFASDAAWCSSLKYLPHFENVSNVTLIHQTEAGRGRLRAFVRSCELAKELVKTRVGWRDHEAAFHILMRKVLLGPEKSKHPS